MHLRLHALVDEPVDQPARHRTGSGRDQQRRCGEADEDADRAAPLNTRAAAVIGRLLHIDGAILGVGDQNRRLDLHLLVRHQSRELGELPRRGFEISVTPHEDIRVSVSHHR